MFTHSVRHFIFRVVIPAYVISCFKGTNRLKALSVAEAVASSPTIKHAFKETKPSNMIQPYAEKVRQRTGAEFVVVGNTEGIRYSHPIPERIGKKMVGGDNGAALSGKAIVSEAVGSLGYSIRGRRLYSTMPEMSLGLFPLVF